MNPEHYISVIPAFEPENFSTRPVARVAHSSTLLCGATSPATFEAHFFHIAPNHTAEILLCATRKRGIDIPFRLQVFAD
jgi:hypothetical protein